MGCYDAALAHTKGRKQFGSALAGFQLVQEKLVRMLANAQAMYLMSWRLSELFVKHGQVTRGQSSLVKVSLFSSLHAHTCAHEVLLTGRETTGAQHAEGARVRSAGEGAVGRQRNHLR
jgi:alkylation response protein AidB-like acyl-CoA dehydrogenase